MELFVTIAPHSYSGSVDVDFICKGKNDESVIQEAVEKVVICREDRK